MRLLRISAKRLKMGPVFRPPAKTLYPHQWPSTPMPRWSSDHLSETASHWLSSWPFKFFRFLPIPQLQNSPTVQTKTIRTNQTPLTNPNYFNLTKLIQITFNKSIYKFTKSTLHDFGDSHRPFLSEWGTAIRLGNPKSSRTLAVDVWSVSAWLVARE